MIERSISMASGPKCARLACDPDKEKKRKIDEGQTEEQCPYQVRI
jgi:hypothetical protein